MQVLVLRALGLGDLLTIVPALRGLRRSLPDARIALAAPAWQAPLARRAGVDAVAPTEGLHRVGPVHWTGGPIDLAVNLHGRGPASTEALRALGPRSLIAAGTVPWDPHEHEVHRWCRLLRAHGIDADERELGLGRLPPPTVTEPGSVVVHPGAGAPARRWPPERFAAVSRALLATGARVSYTGTAADVALCRSVARAAGGGTVLAGRTDVIELAAVVAAAAAVVTNDTGVAHLASATGTPSVVLFGPEPPSRWGPPARGPHRAIWRGRTGDPHGERLDPGLAAITVGEVLDALASVSAACSELGQRGAELALVHLEEG